MDHLFRSSCVNALTRYYSMDKVMWRLRLPSWFRSQATRQASALMSCNYARAEGWVNKHIDFYESEAE